MNEKVKSTSEAIDFDSLPLGESSSHDDSPSPTKVHSL